MNKEQQNNIEDAFNSMLRTDYIPIRDTEKLQRLARYYVDYFGYLRQVVGESDQLIVGRRGTGKTTLLYRALIECIHSWNIKSKTEAKNKTLAIYIDLSKCQTLSDTTEANFAEFEHVFVTELVDSIKEELLRNWPGLGTESALLNKIFYPQESKQKAETIDALKRLSLIITSGIPRTEEEAGPRKLKRKDTEAMTQGAKAGGKIAPNTLEASAEFSESFSSSSDSEIEFTQLVRSRLSIADLLRVLGDLREACKMSHIVVLIDEFSSLSSDLQRRFSTLLRKMLGNHAGVYLKLSAITDNYSLGSAIILQRDLFELSLDLDSFVERSGTLNSAMDGLVDLTRELIVERIKEYTNLFPQNLFEAPEDAWIELSRSGMGVPRTIGIALKQAFYRSLQAKGSGIRKSDIEYGIKYASKAYLNQFLGACGVAIPSYCETIWNSLLDRGIEERTKAEAPCSHFMLLPKNEDKLRYINMFFLAHLVTKGRTTKKEKLSRSLYVFDYGVCLENNLEYGTDKNTIRQQRFAYDSALAEFDIYFVRSEEKKFQCPECKRVYKESELFIAGHTLKFCPADRNDLEEMFTDKANTSSYTEEEMKIIGAIRSSQEEDNLLARQVADDVGCYVQKVAKFGEKLEKERIIQRKIVEDIGKNIYFKKQDVQQMD